MNRKLALGLTTIGAAVVLTACGKNDPVSVDQLQQQGCSDTLLGSFTGSATGASAGSLAGCAYYAVLNDNEDSSYAFGLVLTNNSGLNASPVISIHYEGGRPSAGTYAVGDSAAAAFVGGVFVEPGARSFLAVSGTVTIASSSWESGVKGSLNLTAQEPGSNATIAISATFTAKCSQVSLSDSSWSC